MMELDKLKLKKFECAVELLDASKYLEVRRLYPLGDTPEFRRIYSNYYHLNVAHPSAQFIDRYFDLLFSTEIESMQAPYSQILEELREFPSQNGNRSLQFSFVSKLMATRDERKPVYDKHVRTFFGLSSLSYGDDDSRISKFTHQLNTLSATYNAWEQDRNFKKILAKVREKIPALNGCPATRIADLLVYTVGKHHLNNSGGAA